MPREVADRMCSTKANMQDAMQQFDLRSELLTSIVSYAAARSAAAAPTAFTQTSDTARPEYLWLDLPAATTAA